MKTTLKTSEYENYTQKSVVSGMLNEEELRDAALLVFANKQDLPNAMSAAEVKLHSKRVNTKNTLKTSEECRLLTSCLFTQCAIVIGSFSQLVPLLETDFTKVSFLHSFRV